MTRINNPNRPVTYAPAAERSPSESSSSTTQPNSTRSVSSFERASSVRSTNLTPSTTNTATGSSLTTLAASEIQAAGRTQGANTVELKPMEMLGNLHSGNVYVDMPLDSSLVKSRAIGIADDAKVRVRFAVKDGEIDFKNSKVELDGVRALGLFKIRGAYFNKKGKLKIDMTGPDINISKAVVGESRVPRSMNQFSQALERKHGSKRSSGANGDSGTRAASGSSNTLDKFEGLQFRAEGVALQPNKDLSLGEGNSLSFKPGTRVDLKGDLHNVELSGRVDLNHFNLNSNGTGVELDKGSVDFQATAHRSDSGVINADVHLKNLNLDAPSISHSLGNNEGVHIRDAKIADGEIHARVTVGADGKAALPELHTKGRVSAGSVEYADSGRVVKGNNLRLSLDARGGLGSGGADVGTIKLNDLNGEVSKVSLPIGEGEKPFELENAAIRNGSFERVRNAEGGFDHNGSIEHFKGTLGGEININGRKFKGELGSDKTTVEGGIRFENNKIDGDVKISKTNVELNNANIPLGTEHGAINIRHASLTSDQPNAIHLEGKRLGFEGGGRLEGELGRSTLRFGDKGSLTIAGGTKADLNVEAARVGHVAFIAFRTKVFKCRFPPAPTLW